MRFHKYQAVGNDYIVLDPADFPSWKAPGEAHIRVICHRNFGVGSDGILWGPLPSTKADFGLRIFNSRETACGSFRGSSGTRGR
jgi:diaminopimelate epimerase